MKRREWMTAAAGLAALMPATQAAPSASKSAHAPSGPALLTITGTIARANRGPLDPALDQLMHKQGVVFDQAYTLDYAHVAALRSVSIHPTLEYDAKPHELSGPLLADVAGEAAPDLAAGGTLWLRAIDGYVATVSVADARRYRYIVAHSLDGRPMPLGGLGPLWAVYDADRFADMAAKPLPQRFSSCPWALYHIELRAG